MKILVLSDLHLEFSSFWPSETDADIVVLAGDIGSGDQVISWARAVWDNKPIVYVAGNHEFYKHEKIATERQLKVSAFIQNMYMLEKTERIINGIRFLGTTLWTDFNLFGEENREKCLAIANQSLNDFRLIRLGDKTFSAEDSLECHKDNLEWLTTKLINEPFDGQTVVVTHHSPSWQSVAKRYQHDLLSACFSSRLEHLMGHCKLWIHGHTHESFDYVINGTRVICNPRGYVIGRAENVQFDPEKIVEI